MTNSLYGTWSPIFHPDGAGAWMAKLDANTDRGGITPTCAEQSSGAGVAAALAVHRFLEGSAFALTGSATVALALAVHAFGEGLATGALLGAQPRRMAGWLAAMSISPLIGAAVADAFSVPEAAEPVLLALAAGVIAQAAWVSLRAAFHGLRTSRLLPSYPAAATAMAVVVTALAVHAAG